jgi:flagellar biosynthesis protein FlhF
MQAAAQSHPSIVPGKKYRFVVQSAAEAVEIIRERMGESARVLSVKQVENGGLARFLRAPKLEVVAHIPEETAAETGSKSEAGEATQTGGGAAPSAASPAEAPDAPAPEAAEATGQEPAEAATDRVPRKRLTRFPEEKPARSLESVLRSSGFDEKTLQLLSSSPEWESLREEPATQGLSRAAATLRRQFAQLPQMPLSKRVAFLGTAGSGKTTTLCKQLAAAALIDRSRVSVLKLDDETPNPDDALRVFCEVMGVPFVHGLGALAEQDEDEAAFIDCPGLAIDRVGSWRNTARVLDEFSVPSRVLVLNAAYEPGVLKRTVETAREAGVSHLVLSHLDEVANPCGLLAIVLGAGLHPLLGSMGPSVAGEHTNDLPSLLLERAFPFSFLHRV